MLRINKDDATKATARFRSELAKAEAKVELAQGDAAQAGNQSADAARALAVSEHLLQP